MKYSFRAYIASVIAVWCAFETDLQAQALVVHAGPAYVIIDYTGPLPPGQTLFLERYSQPFDTWSLLGSFQKPHQEEAFFDRYYSTAAAYPELAWVPVDSIRLRSFWASKHESLHIDDLEPYRDRVIASAMGYSVLLPRKILAQTDRVRVKDPDGNVLADIPFEIPAETVWPFVHFQDMNIDDRYTAASWWAPFTGTILGFKVYRSVEYRNAFTLYDAVRSLGLHADTMIFIIRDTMLAAPGIYQYYITLLDIAGNEGPPSPVVRMPNMGGLPLPHIHHFSTVSRSDIRAVELHWRITQPERIRTLHIYREHPSTGEKEHIATVPPSDSSYIDHVQDVQRSYFYQLEVMDVVWPEPIRTAPVFGSSAKTDTAFANIRLDIKPIEKGISLDIRVDHAMYLDGFFVTRGPNFDPELEVISELIRYSPGDSLLTYVDTSESLEGDVPYGYSLLLASDSYMLSPYRDTVFGYPGVSIRIPEPELIMETLQADGKARIAWAYEAFDDMPIRHYLVCKADQQRQPIREACQEVSWDKNSIEIPDAAPGDIFLVRAVHVKGDEGPWASTGSLAYAGERIEGPEHLWLQRPGERPVIAWVPVSDPRIRALALYRRPAGDDKAVPEHIATLSPGESEYEDTTLIPKTSITYQLVPELHDGRPGIPSQVLYVRYE